MSGRPATVIQADIARAIRAAQKEGAAAVEVHLPTGAFFIIRLTPLVDAPSLVPAQEIIL
jgi:hypothetical protein